MRPTAVDGAAAALAELERAAGMGEPFPLVLLDAMMPEVDGFGLAEQIQRHPELAGAILLMLSSAARPEDAERCRRLGIATYLTKPVKQSELLDAILTARHAAAPATDNATPADAAVPGPHRLRVLLAEDNLVNQRLAARLLEKQGHRVVVAGNGREALEALEREGFDLVLMDVQMPELGGLEATPAIRRREAARGGLGPGGRRVPVIAMTAHAMKGDRERCLAAGMDDYVSKPVRGTELFAAIARVLLPGGAPPAVAGGEEFDRDGLLESFGGDLEIVREVAGMFLAGCPGMLAALKQAVERGDAEAVHRAAHTLKGSAGNFGTGAAYAAAQRLEEMGRAHTLAGAGEAFAALADALERLRADLERVLAEGGGS
jgi:CheY-like chemotaxis protein